MIDNEDYPESLTMKTKLSLILASLAMAFSVGAGVASTKINKSVEPVEAAQHADNYSSYTYSGNYYSSAFSTYTEGLNGTLRTNLTTLIHPTSVPEYSSGLATHLQQADADPTNSSNMVYLYTRDSVKKNSASSWNREHVWPKALSNSCWKESRAGADMLHLRPTYSTPNSTRSSYKYGEVTKNQTNLKIYNQMEYGYYANNYFMPLDATKGDVARICMYIWVAYYNEYGSELPSLTNVFQSFDVLMTWHTNDRPDVLEGNRNNYAEKNVQYNRNPFVDHPEYAWKIFGSQCSQSVLNAAKAAYPDGDPVGITSISKSSITMAVGETTTISATSSNSASITWSSDDESVTVSPTTQSSGSDVTLTAVSEGSATITASVTISGTTYSATCVVTVTSSGGGDDESSWIATPITDLTSTDVFVIVGNNGSNYAMSNDNGTSSAPSAVSVTVSGNKITSDVSDNIKWNISISNNQYKFYPNGDSESWLYATDTNNGVRVGTDDSNQFFNITDSYIYNIGTSRYLGIYSSSNWRCYTSINANISGQTFAFYKYSGETPSPAGTYTVTYSKNTTDQVDNMPSNITGITSGATVTLTGNPTRDGYTFEGWSLTNDGEIITTISNITEDKNVYAIWEEIKPTSITASLKESRVFYVGEIITRDDITVETNTGVDVTSDVEFPNYMFVYDDSNGGNTTKNKSFTIEYSTLPSTTLTVQVKRTAYAAPSTSATDTLDIEATGVTSGSTSYSNWSGVTSVSSAVYAGNSAGGNDSIQLRSKNSNSGIITTKSGGKLSEVSVAWNSNTESGRTLNVYGKNSAYSTAENLYNTSNQGTLLGTIVCGTSTSLTISGDYAYVGVRSSSGAMYITSITFEYSGSGGETAKNVSNYIMYEDTNNQCNTKLDIAIGYLNNLTQAELNSFVTKTESQDYVIYTARTRLNAWAASKGKTINYSTAGHVTLNSYVNPIINAFEEGNATTIIIIIGIIGLTALGGYIFIRKRKEI